MTLLCGALSCSMQRTSETWSDDVLDAHTLQDDGDFLSAEARWETLRRSAPSRAHYRWVTAEMAESAEERGATDRALELYRELYAEEIIDEYGANALFASARILEARGDHAEASRLHFRVLLHYPNEMAAELALEEIVDAYTRDGLLTTLEYVLALVYPSLKPTFLGDNVLWHLAKSYDLNRDSPDQALDTYRRLYRDHPNEMLADDALWEMAEIYRRHQNWAPAIHNLNMIAENTETSWFVGDYNSQWVDNAIYDLGMIHLVFLGEYDTAVRYFERYVEEYEFSDYADDAYWNACEARRLQGEDLAHLQMLKRFLSKFPESRYAERARARLAISDQP